MAINNIGKLCPMCKKGIIKYGKILARNFTYCSNEPCKTNDDVRLYQKEYNENKKDDWDRFEILRGNLLRMVLTIIVVMIVIGTIAHFAK